MSDGWPDRAVRQDLIDSVRAIPPGFVTSFDAIAALLDVMPRQVAHLLETLDDDNRDNVPWHRVVSVAGYLPSRDTDRFAEQRARLAREGVNCDDAGHIDDFLGRLTAVLVVTRRNVGSDDDLQN